MSFENRQLQPVADTHVLIEYILGLLGLLFPKNSLIEQMFRSVILEQYTEKPTGSQSYL